MHVALQSSLPPALEAYVSRIQRLSGDAIPGSDDPISSEPEPERRLLAHSYIRYVGDLSGGQILRRSVAKAYKLEDQEGLGTSFYGFSKLGESGKSATTGDMGKIKDWFRHGMDDAAGNDEEFKRKPHSSVFLKPESSLTDVIQAQSWTRLLLRTD